MGRMGAHLGCFMLYGRDCWSQKARAGVVTALPCTTKNCKKYTTRRQPESPVTKYQQQVRFAV